MNKHKLSEKYRSLLSTYLEFYPKLKVPEMDFTLISDQEQFQLEIQYLNTSQSPTKISGDPMDVFLQIPLVIKQLIELNTNMNLPCQPSFNCYFSPFLGDVAQRFENSDVMYMIQVKASVVAYDMAQLLKDNLPQQALYFYQFAWLAFGKSVMINFKYKKIAKLRQKEHPFVSTLLEQTPGFWETFQDKLNTDLLSHTKEHFLETLNNISSTRHLDAILNNDTTFLSNTYQEFEDGFKTKSVIKAAKLCIEFIDDNFNNFLDLYSILKRVEFLIYWGIREEKNIVKFAELFEPIFFRLLAHPHPVIRQYTAWIGGIWVNRHLSIGIPLLEKVLEIVIMESPIIVGKIKHVYWGHRLNLTTKEINKLLEYYPKARHI